MIEIATHRDKELVAISHVYSCALRVLWFRRRSLALEVVTLVRRYRWVLPREKAEAYYRDIREQIEAVDNLISRTHL